MESCYTIRARVESSAVLSILGLLSGSILADNNRLTRGPIFMRKKMTPGERKQSLKEASARWHAKPGNKERQRKSHAVWLEKLGNKEKQKEASARYGATPEGKKKKRESQARWLAKPGNKESRIQYRANPKNRERIRATRLAVRLEMIEEYGGRCKCCSEAEPQFLSVDHINNDGAEERKIIKTSNIAHHLKKLGWPKDRYQLLCHNCNISKHINGGECIHKRVPVV